MSAAEANPLFNIFGEALAGYMDGMDSSQEQFHADQQRSGEEMNQAMSELASRIGRRNQKPKRPDDVEKIADMLVQFPQIKPAVQALVDQYVGEVNAAYRAVNEKYNPQGGASGNDQSQQS
jgi:hypothetical protein